MQSCHQAADSHGTPAWIRVSERLPECDATVLISNGDRIETGYRSKDAWFVLDGYGGTYLNLSDYPFWMPLPAPPTNAK